jgi:cob(I)alamin adenosyltransferase
MSQDDINAAHKDRMERLKAAQDRLIEAKTVEKGLVIVHTGSGKGKTTAALGMACRCIGHGLKVSVIQFIKGAMPTGESVVFDAFPHLAEFRATGGGFTWDTQDRDADIALVRVGWEAAKARILDPDWKMVVCDELNIVLDYGYLPVEEVLEALAQRPADKHVVITGRRAPQALVDAADLVSDMGVIKHPFREQGVKAQPGIEF